MMSTFFRRFGRSWSKLAGGSACVLSVASWANRFEKNEKIYNMEPYFESNESRESVISENNTTVNERLGEQFLSTIAKLRNLTKDEIPYFHLPLGGSFPSTVLKGTNVHFCDYSSNYGDYDRFMASTVVIVCSYARIGNKKLNSTGLRTLGYLQTPPDIPGCGNGVVVGNPDWKTSNIIGTAYHVIAKYIDEAGQECDENGIVVGTNMKTQYDFVFELTSCQANGEAIEILSQDASNDIACIKWKGSRVSADFMLVGEYVDNPMNAVITGKTLHYGKYHDMNDAVVSKKDKENIFGKQYEMYTMGLRKDKVNPVVYPRMFDSQNGCSIIKKQISNPQKVLHYLFSLPGHSGTGISIEPEKVCCIHTAGSIFENEATIINETITQHLV